ncbi:TIGR01244 family phosphatase [Altererythrobacter salegens]|uniref:TIGR01244 family phosphatase n=1 Tax=Croceibacterium salegens TaxID=1737568 RepID=A0A6I4SR93_9SPHN|nr:TIGR01244 family sulfur transferase [Croceibacterium salegens]MXO58384.1 TIGR01244 family phosphatase [Croceibacterium salegens]
METKKLDDTLCIRPQVLPEQLAEAARLGFRSVINNRPDGEEPGQPTSDQVAAAAHAAGLEYRHIPVIPGQITDDAIDAFQRGIAEMPKPIVGFCRTGTRAAMLWALSNAREIGADNAIECAAGAGCDISGIRARLEQRGG